MQIIIDFDYTLFNTEAFRQGLMTLMQPFGITLSEYRKKEQEVLEKHGVYLFQEHLALLFVDSINPKLGQQLGDFFSDLSSFLYADALPFLQQYKKEQLILLTFGNPEWQLKKVQATGIEPYFSDEHYCDQPKELLLQQWPAHSQTIVINDRAKEIDAMYAIQPNWFYVLLQRLDSKYQQEVSVHADQIIYDLNIDLYQLIATL